MKITVVIKLIDSANGKTRFFMRLLNCFTLFCVVEVILFEGIGTLLGIAPVD